MHVTLKGELINYLAEDPSWILCFFNCNDKTCDSQTLTRTKTLKGGGFGLTMGRVCSGLDGDQGPVEGE